MAVQLHRYGVIQDEAAIACAESHQCLVFDVRQLARQWRRCGLTADFWARYASLFLSAEPRAGWLSRDSGFHVFSYLLNELLENCVKFSAGPITALRFDAWIFPDHLVYQISNHIAPGDVQGFAELIQALLNADVEELYFRKLEQNAESNARGSGLGYLTLMKDYGIRFGYGFEQIGPESVRVDIQTLVSKKES